MTAPAVPTILLTTGEELHRFLAQARRRVVVDRSMTAVCRATFWVALAAIPVVAFRARLGLGDLSLFVAIVLCIVAVSGWLLWGKHVRLRQLPDYLRAEPDDHDRITSATEFMDDPDPFKRLAVRQTEHWLRAEAPTVPTARTWPPHATRAAFAVAVLVAVWLLTPSAAVAAQPPAAPTPSPTSTPSDDASSTTEPPPTSSLSGQTTSNDAGSKSPGASESGENNNAGTAGNENRSGSKDAGKGDEKADGEGNGGAAGVGGTGAGTTQGEGGANNAAGGPRDKTDGPGDPSAANPLNADGQTSPTDSAGPAKPANSSAKTDGKTPPASPTPASATPVQESKTGSPEAEPVPTSVVQSEPGTAGRDMSTSSADDKQPANRKPAGSSVDVSAGTGKTESSGPEQERLGAMDPSSPSPIAPGQAGTNRAYGIGKLDVAELDDLPPDRRRVVVEYFRRSPPDAPAIAPTAP